MIALTVLVVVASALGTSMITSNNLSRQSRETRIACTALAQAMEAVRASPQGAIPTTFAPGVAAPADSLLEGLTITPTYPAYVVGTEVPALLTIVLEARWTSFNGSERTQTLVSAKGS